MRLDELHTTRAEPVQNTMPIRRTPNITHGAPHTSDDAAECDIARQIGATETPPQDEMQSVLMCSIERIGPSRGLGTASDWFCIVLDGGRFHTVR